MFEKCTYHLHVLLCKSWRAHTLHLVLHNQFDSLSFFLAFQKKRSVPGNISCVQFCARSVPWLWSPSCSGISVSASHVVTETLSRLWVCLLCVCFQYTTGVYQERSAQVTESASASPSGATVSATVRRGKMKLTAVRHSLNTFAASKWIEMVSTWRYKSALSAADILHRSHSHLFCPGTQIPSACEVFQMVVTFSPLWRLYWIFPVFVQYLWWFFPLFSCSQWRASFPRAALWFFG